LHGYFKASFHGASSVIKPNKDRLPQLNTLMKHPDVISLETCEWYGYVNTKCFS